LHALIWNDLCQWVISHHFSPVGHLPFSGVLAFLVATRPTEEEAEEPFSNDHAEGDSLSGGVFSSAQTTAGRSVQGALDGAGCFDDESF